MPIYENGVKQEKLCMYYIISRAQLSNILVNTLLTVNNLCTAPQKLDKKQQKKGR